MMKLSVCVQTDEVFNVVPVALFSGPFAERAQKAAMCGYDGLELMPINPRSLSAANVRMTLMRYSLQVAAVSSGAIASATGLTLLHPDPDAAAQARSLLGDLIDFAARLGAPLVTIGSFRGWLKRVGGGEVARSQLVAILRQGAELAESRGVRLALEPLNRYESDVVSNVADGLIIIEDVDHPALGLLLDTYHMNIEEPDIASSIRTAASRLWHVHLGDSNRLAPGEGHFDFALAVDTLRAVGYSGFLSAELLPQPDPDLAARNTIQTMRRLVPPTWGGMRRTPSHGPL
jgi:sugar phosphate isomerase/epimerase